MTNNQRPAKQPDSKALLEALYSIIGEEKANKDEPFRDFQVNTIQAILEGHDVLAIVPTGGGKSLCYQVPAMLLPGITLVVSPLLALMRDQVETLRKRGIAVACLSSDFIVDHDENPHEAKGRHGAEGGRGKGGDGDKDARPDSFRTLRNKIFEDALSGDPQREYKLLYVTPERLRDERFIRFARRADISMIAVDEAHCISLWGYEFRPRYLEIARLLKHLNNRPVVAAFTATATKRVRKDIVDLLKLRNCKLIDKGPAPRENLIFSVRHMPAAKTQAAKKRLKHQKLLRDLQRRKDRSGYVYCSTANEVNEVYGYLKDRGISVTRYYSDLDQDPQREKDESKKRNYGDFLENRKNVIVTTNALGMGVDKSDVRFVIHYNLPLCLENYYQEAGRAGRDGKKADCILYYSESDCGVCNTLIRSSVAESERSRKDRTILRRVAENRLAHMRQYAEYGHGQKSDALQNIILEYLREYDPYDELAKKELEKEHSSLLSGEALQQKSSELSELDALAQLNRVDVLYVNRTKIANELRKGSLEGTVSVGRRHKTDTSAKDSGMAPDMKSKLDNDVTVYYKVTGETPPVADEPLPAADKPLLTYFDLMVADAVYTLMAHRVPIIYARTVMGLLSGDPELMLRKNRTEDVEKSIRKMIRTRILIDRTNSARYGFTFDDQGKKTILEGPFLPLYERDGKNGFGYADGAVPPLYEYAEILNGQFYTFPIRYLRVARPSAPKKEKREDGNGKEPRAPVTKLYASVETLAMTHYLLCRVNMGPAVYDKKQNTRAITGRRISFDKMVKTLGIDLLNGTHTRRRRNAVWEKMCIILEHLQESGVILEFDATNKGQYVTFKRPRRKSSRHL